MPAVSPMSAAPTTCYTEKNKNKMPAKAFTPPAETKMGTRPDKAVTREFIGGGGGGWGIFTYFCSPQLIPF